MKLNILTVGLGVFTLAAGISRAGVLTAHQSSGPLNQVIPNGDVFGFSSSLNFTEGTNALVSDVSVTLNLSGGYNGDLYAYLVHDNTLGILLNRVGRTGSDTFGYGDQGFSVTFSTLNGLDLGTDVHQYQTVGGWNGYLSGGQLTGTGIWAADGRTASPLSVVDLSPRTALLGNFVSNEVVAGEWKLVVADMVGGGDNSSTLQSWELGVVYNVPEPVSAATLMLGLTGLMLWCRRDPWRS